MEIPMLSKRKAFKTKAQEEITSWEEAKSVIENMNPSIEANYDFMDGGDSIQIFPHDQAKIAKELEERVEQMTDWGEYEFNEYVAGSEGIDMETLETDGGWEAYTAEVASDNTFNDAHFLPPIEFKILEIKNTGELFASFEVHSGTGDVRANYLPPRFSRVESKEEGYQLLSEIVGGSISVDLTFDNGDSLELRSYGTSGRDYEFEMEDSSAQNEETETLVEYLEGEDTNNLNEIALRLIGTY